MRISDWGFLKSCLNGMNHCRAFFFQNQDGTQTESMGYQ